MIRALIALTALSVAGPALALDLLDIYRGARLNDARYAAARAQFRAMQERVPQARAGLQQNPRVDAGSRHYDLGLNYDASALKSGRRTFHGHVGNSNVTVPSYRRR